VRGRWFQEPARIEKVPLRGKRQTTFGTTRFAPLFLSSQINLQPPRV
jgi:hypothetical protein